MRRFSTLLALLICSAFTPAKAETITAEQCSKIWDQAQPLLREFDLLSQGEGQVFVAGEWCRMDGWHKQVEGRPYPVYALESIEWRGDGLAEFADTGLTATTFEVRANGFRVFAQVGDPAMDYVYRTQSTANAIDLEVLLTWDRETLDFQVARVFVDFPRENSISFSATFENVDENWWRGTSDDPEAILLKHLSLEAESNGLFEFFALPWIAPGLLGQTENVELEVLALKAKAIALIARLDTQVFSGETKRALVELVADMPLPRGTLKMNANFPDGFGAQDAEFVFETAMSAPLLGFSTGMTITAEYERSNLEP